MPAKRKSAEMSSEAATSCGCDLASLAQEFDGAALAVASHLEARDLLRLQTVDRSWRSLVASHEDTLFSNLTRTSWVEGKLLLDIVEERKGWADHEEMSHKAIYRAFHRRWKFWEERDGNEAYIHWTRSDVARSDIGALVFIARIGEHCMLMDWPKARMSRNLREGALTLKSYTECSFFIRREQVTEDWDSYQDPRAAFLDKLEPHTHVTLHVVDTQRAKVMTIMESAPPRDVKYRIVKIGNSGLEEYIKTKEHGLDNLLGKFPTFYGFPGNRPLLRNWDRDYDSPDGVEYLSVKGYIAIGPSTKDGSIFKARDEIGLYFLFEGRWNRRDVDRWTICSFLRAAMNVKCC